MRLTGFDLTDYERLLDAALEEGWRFLTVEEYLRNPDREGPFVVLRHDVDRRLSNAVAMADSEAERGVQSTYYFRTSTFDPDVVRSMSEQGHEIGYHYEDLAKTRGDVDAARDRFAENLAQFRQHADVTTVCAHGSPLSPHTNTEMWTDDGELEAYDLLGEAYLSIDFDNQRQSGLFYLSDTSRDWDAELPNFGRVRTTDCVIDAIRSGSCSKLYLLAHPCRWSKSRLEFLERSSWDVAAETVKSVVKRAHRFQRA